MHPINLYLLLTHTLITSLLANPVPVTNHTSTPNNARRSYFTPVREPEMHPVECHDEAEFRGHADIKPKFFFEGVYKFCQQRYDTTQVLDASDDPTNPAYHDGNGRLARNASWRYRDWHGVNHDFRVWWEAGCRVTVGKQSVRRPLGEEGGPVWTPGCYEIMGSTHYESVRLNRNLSEETKDTNSSGGTNRSSGESAGGTRSKGKPKGELSSTVDTLLNKALGFGAASEAEKKKSGAA
ncbi:hypothetical protein CLIM01_07539 [Colletotrichum limetticola]|uniref:Uncharacterized protein n=1 Tax=Colletotrichum limetticola TaxID=1209924 RepID=A0ABQ9PUF5_9PEZI|nr:hypothetical protein CLIM01_07539 [Colletotrichum limetticola]